MNATEAAKLSLESKTNQDGILNADLEIILPIIYKDIARQAENSPEDATVYYSWSKPNELTSVFPGIKNYLFACDNIKPLGKLLKNTMEHQGYEVYLDSNSLRISWRRALSALTTHAR